MWECIIHSKVQYFFENIINKVISSKHRIKYFIIFHFFNKIYRVQTRSKISFGRSPESFQLEKNGRFRSPVDALVPVHYCPGSGTPLYTKSSFEGFFLSFLLWIPPRWAFNPHWMTLKEKGKISIKFKTYTFYSICFQVNSQHSESHL